MYHYNPCKVGRHPALIELGDWLAYAFQHYIEDPTDGCPCCMAVRILTLAAGAAAIGLGLGLLL